MTAKIGKLTGGGESQLKPIRGWRCETENTCVLNGLLEKALCCLTRGGGNIIFFRWAETYPTLEHNSRR